MALASKLFDTSVLVSWEVFKLPEDAPYSVQATVTWASVEACQSALSSEEDRLLVDDLKNYSKRLPVVMLCQSIASVYVNGLEEERKLVSL